MPSERWFGWDREKERRHSFRTGRQSSRDLDQQCGGKRLGGRETSTRAAEDERGRHEQELSRPPAAASPSTPRYLPGPILPHKIESESDRFDAAHLPFPSLSVSGDASISAVAFGFLIFVRLMT